MSPNPEDARYTLTELADLAGVSPRTVRYYLHQGLLPTVGVSGPGAKYDDTHLARLRVIRRLQRAHQPLAEIRNQLETLDDAAIAELSSMGAAPRPPNSALDYIRQITAPQGSRLQRTESPGAGTPRAMGTAPAMVTAPAMRITPAPSATLAKRLEGPIPTAPTTQAAAPPPPAPGMPARDDQPEPQPEPPPRIERSQWDRLRLGPDIELHIRRPLPRSTAKRVDRLIEIARDLLEEELP